MRALIRRSGGCKTFSKIKSVCYNEDHVTSSKAPEPGTKGTLKWDCLLSRMKFAFSILENNNLHDIPEFTSIFFMSKPHRWFHFWFSTLWAQLVLLYLLYCINLGSSQETLIPTHQLLELKMLLEVRIQQGMAENVRIFNEHTCRRYMCAFACFVKMGVREFNTFCWLHLGNTK